MGKEILLAKNRTDVYAYKIIKKISDCNMNLNLDNIGSHSFKLVQFTEDFFENYYTVFIYKS